MIPKNLNLVRALKRRLRNRRTWINLALLAPLFAAVYTLSWQIRFEGRMSPYAWEQFFYSIGWVLTAKLALFVGVYGSNHWSRHLTFHDLGTLAKASTLSSLLLLIADYFFQPHANIPRSVFLMDWFATVIAVGAIQAFIRWYRESSSDLINGGGRPVLIVGANDAGESLLREIRRGRDLPYRVVGFVADCRTSVGTRLGGVPVLGTIEQTCEIAESHDIQEVLISAGELTGKQVRTLVDDGKQRGVRVQVLPSFEQLLNGRVGLRPREVSIEDLLRRDPVELDQRGLRNWLTDQVIMVTGAAGSIGSEICRQLLQFNPRSIVLVDRSECGQFFLERELQAKFPGQDIHVCMADGCDRERLNQLFEIHRPSIVFHAAAYKHVPMMERNRGEAVKNIVLMTRNIADMADAHNVESFVMISTDKAVNPTSVMGACKRVAELYVQSLALTSHCRFVTVRFGNVLDSAGSVVPIFRQQIAAGGPITVTHEDMTRFFMMIPEAAQLVIQAGGMGHGGEIFVLDMGEPVRIIDLARDMIELSGLRVGDDIEIETVGVRPGEKLYEELHVDGERHVETTHPKIMVAESARINRFEVVATVTRLEKMVHLPGELILSELQRLIPQFQHQDLQRLPAARQKRAIRAA